MTSKRLRELDEAVSTASDGDDEVTTESEPDGETLGSEDTSDSDDFITLAQIREANVQRDKKKKQKKMAPADIKAPRDQRQAVKFTLTQQLQEETHIDAVKAFEELHEHHKKLYEDKRITYCVWGLEAAPTTGKWHGQGYLELPAGGKKTKAGVRKLYEMLDMEFPFVDIANGTAQQNREYCLKLKEAKPNVHTFELGEPRSDARQGPGKRMQVDWERARKLAEDGRLMEVESSLLIQHYGNLEKIGFATVKPYKELEVLDNVWVYGAPGVGKSMWAREQAQPGERLYFKDALNKWFDGYKHEEIVVIDDFEKDSKYQGHILKTLADRYPLRVEIKGASTWIRPRRVIVTSNYKIEDVWDDPAIVQALKRRFRVKYIEPQCELCGTRCVDGVCPNRQCPTPQADICTGMG